MKFVLDRCCHYLGCSLCQFHRIANRNLWPEEHGKPKTLARSRFPGVAALAAPGALMFRNNNKAFRRTTVRHLQHDYVRRFSSLDDHDFAATRAPAKVSA